MTPLLKKKKGTTKPLRLTRQLIQSPLVTAQSFSTGYKPTQKNRAGQTELCKHWLRFPSIQPGTSRQTNDSSKKTRVLWFLSAKRAAETRLTYVRWRQRACTWVRRLSVSSNFSFFLYIPLASQHRASFMDAKISKLYYSPQGYWKGIAAIKKSAEAAKVS